MFDHILVPVDFTYKNSAALAAAVQLAQPNGAQVTLLHVIEKVEMADSDELTTFYEELQQRSEDQLKTLADGITADGVAVNYQTILERRVPGIVFFADDNDIDLIVMSSHRVEPGSRSERWATISYQVAVLCPCTVMLVKETDDEE